MANMFASHPAAVHPMDLELAAAAAAAAPVGLPPGVLANDLPGMPGTPVGLLLYTMQFFFAVVSVWFLFCSSKFNTTNGFWFLFGSNLFHCAWSSLISCLCCYSLLVKHSFRNYLVVPLFAVGDAMTWVVTFTGASAVGCVSYFIGSDVMVCSEKHNHCGNFKFAVAFAFCCLFSLSPSLLLNLYYFASLHV